MTLQDEYYNQIKHPDPAGDLKYFISKFECRVEDSREYNQYVKQSHPYHRDFYSTDNYKVEAEIVPMKAIHLTRDNLASLVAEQEHMQRLHDNDAFHKRIWTQIHEDKRVRDENPTVEKAYRNYQMLLELARK